MFWVAALAGVIWIATSVFEPGCTIINDPRIPKNSYWQEHPLATFTEFCCAWFIYLYASLQINRCLFFKALWRFDCQVMVWAAVGGMALQLRDDFRWSHWTSTFEWPWFVLHVSSMLLIFVPLLIFLGTMDACTFSKRFKVLAITFSVTTRLIVNLRRRFEGAQHPPDDELCVALFCGTSWNLQSNAEMCTIIFLLKPLVCGLWGYHFVVVRPYYTEVADEPIQV